MKKKGISAIVATVLIILITIAAVTILWSVILPMTRDVSDIQDPNSRLEVATSGGYTFYDNGMLYIQVKRGNDNAIITGLEIIVTTRGESRTYKYNSTYVPSPNQAIVIRIWVGTKPDYVKVVPIFFSGNALKKGIESSKAEIGDGKAAPPGKKTPMICDTNNDCYNGEICSETKYCECTAGELEYENGCAIPISNCGFSGWVSGKNYLVTQDLSFSGTCLTITQNNIVLDGNGKTITTAGAMVGHGIYVNGKSRLTIKNFGKITTSSEETTNVGIYLVSVSNSMIKDVVIENYPYGILLYLNSNNNNLTDVTAKFSLWTGIVIYNSLGNILTRVTVNSNNVGIDILTAQTDLNYLASSNSCENYNSPSTKDENLVCLNAGIPLELVDLGGNTCSPSTSVQEICGISCAPCEP
jgi:flagellin-like protein